MCTDWKEDVNLYLGMILYKENSKQSTKSNLLQKAIYYESKLASCKV